jgi:hypothetical protein
MTHTLRNQHGLSRTWCVKVTGRRLKAAISAIRGQPLIPTAFYLLHSQAAVVQQQQQQPAYLSLVRFSCQSYEPIPHQTTSCEDDECWTCRVCDGVCCLQKCAFWCFFRFLLRQLVVVVQRVWRFRCMILGESSANWENGIINFNTLPNRRVSTLPDSVLFHWLLSSCAFSIIEWAMLLHYWQRDQLIH